MKNNNINKTINKFFKDSKEAKDLFGNLCLVVFRSDGHVLYNNNAGPDVHSIGALMCGVWQAAFGLKGFLKKKDDLDEFRLSFDTTDKGIYIIPISIQKNDYFLGSMFDFHVNPGQLKSNLRVLAKNLVKYLDDNFVAKENEQGVSLFSQLTDDEINNAFQNMGY